MRTAIATEYRIWDSDGRYALPASKSLLEVAHNAAARGISDLFYHPDSLHQPATLGEAGYIDATGCGRISTPGASVFVHNLATSAWWDSHYEHHQLDHAYHTLMQDYDSAKANLGVRFLGFSPAWRGVHMIGAKRQQHPEWFNAEKPPERPDDKAPDYCRALDWTVKGQWLHMYDMRAAYLAAARTVPTGVGGIAATATFDPNRVGLWATAPKTPIPRGTPCAREGWYNTASVRAALARGSSITISAGYVWAGHATPLRAFCDAVTRSKDAGYNHPGMMTPLHKKLYTRALGTFSSNTGRAGDWKYQPYWWTAIIAESARRLWANIANDPYTIATETDKIFRVTPEADPATFAKWAEKRTGGAGTLRYDGSVRVDSALIEATKNGSGAQLADHIRKHTTPRMMDGMA